MTASTDRAIDLFVDAGMLAHEQDVLDQALAELGDCLGGMDHTGRCTECGRLVVRIHDRRGCAYAVPVLGQLLWLRENALSLPFLGKALWLAKRRRKLSTAGAVPVRPPAAPAVESPAAGIDPGSAPTANGTEPGR